MQPSVSLNVIRLVFVLIAGWIGLFVGLSERELALPLTILIGLLFGLLIVLLDIALRSFSIRGFSHGTVGLFIGLLCAWLVTRIGLFQGSWIQQFDLLGELINVAIFLALGFLGLMLALRSKREEFSLLIPYVRFRQDAAHDLPTLVPTDALIEGKIAAICRSGFLGGPLVIPEFVIDELKSMSDSTREWERLRGERGLLELEDLRSIKSLEVTVIEVRLDDPTEVDILLIEEAHRIGARLISDDESIAKLARIRNVPLLSPGNLREALSPSVTPGDRLSLKLIKEGREDHQAVGFLGDGTMIVVNEAREKIGTHHDVIVAGETKTSAGRLIFAELAS
ncbi:MAG: hypothetical protein AAF236_05860 [Verrucomicrobiota bacterium]